MKPLLITILAFELFAGAQLVRGQDDNALRAQVAERSQGNRWRLRRDVDRLNDMLGFVRARMQRYSASPAMWRRYSATAGKVSEINFRYRRGANPDRLREDIIAARRALERLERDLRFREWYRWD